MRTDATPVAPLFSFIAIETVMNGQNNPHPLTAFDHRILDAVTLEIVLPPSATGAQVRGIPLADQDRESSTVNRIAAVDKESREQFEMRTPNDCSISSDPTPQTFDALIKPSISPPAWTRRDQSLTEGEGNTRKCVSG